jgi:hypothetical protein
MGSGGIAPLFLTSALNGGMRSASRASALSLDEHPLYRRLGGIQSLSGLYGEEKISPLPGIEPRFLCRPVRSLVALSTQLSCFLIWRVAANVLNNQSQAAESSVPLA